MKKLFILFLASIMLLPLCACAEDGYRDDIDTAELTEKIKAALPLPDGYAEHGGDYVNFRFEDIEEHTDKSRIIYSRDSRRADLVAVFHAKSASDIDDVKRICGEFIEDQRALFSSVVEQYMPSESVKLDAAELRIFGNYAVLCVLSPSDARVAFEVARSALNSAQSP